MKIGYLAQLSPEVRQPPFDGPANHIRQVVFKLKEHGHEVTFLAGLDGQYYRSSELINFQPVKLIHKNKYDPGLMERGIRRIQRVLNLPYINFFESLRFANVCHAEFSDYDFLFERASWMGYGGAMAARAMRIPHVIEYNGDPLHDLEAKHAAPKGFQKWLSSLFFKKTLESAYHIVASGKGWEENLIQRWGVDSNKVTTIENGTPLVDLLNRNQLKSFKQDNDSVPVKIIYLGGFYAWHGTMLAVQAFKRIIDAGLDAHLIMIGSGKQLDETRELAINFGLENKITFTGSLTPEEYAPILATGEIGLSPYCGWKEYSGLKLFDYKAAGLATIASGENGQPNTLIHEHTGLIVPPCNLDALTDAIITLIKRPEYRHRMGQNARIEAETSHGWDHTVREIENVFNQILPRVDNINKVKQPHAARK